MGTDMPLKADAQLAESRKPRVDGMGASTTACERTHPLDFGPRHKGAQPVGCMT
jgi:hypothetical protein